MPVDKEAEAAWEERNIVELSDSWDEPNAIAHLHAGFVAGFRAARSAVPVDPRLLPPVLEWKRFTDADCAVCAGRGTVPDHDPIYGGWRWCDCARANLAAHRVGVAPSEPKPEAPKKRRVVIESPFGRNPDGSKCTPAQYARNARYLDRCIRDSLARGEAPYASHGFFPAPGRLDDTIPEQRKQGIDAGLAWGEAAHLRACYLDHGATEGMERALAEQGRIPVESRYIGKEPDDNG